MDINASDFRRRLFSILDACIEDGVVYRVKRKTGVVEVQASCRRVPIANLPERPGALLDGESLDSFSPAEWHPS